MATVSEPALNGFVPATALAVHVDVNDPSATLFVHRSGLSFPQE